MRAVLLCVHTTLAVPNVKCCREIEGLLTWGSQADNRVSSLAGWTRNHRGPFFMSSVPVSTFLKISSGRPQRHLHITGHFQQCATLASIKISLVNTAAGISVERAAASMSRAVLFCLIHRLPATDPAQRTSHQVHGTATAGMQRLDRHGYEQ
jgi:hypothetical protein